MELMCKNHPLEVASSKCYQCQQPICTACEIHKAQQVFCSQSCYRRFVIHRLSRDPMARWPEIKRAMTHYWEQFKKIPRLPYWLILSWLTLAVLLSLLLSLVSICEVNRWRPANQPSAAANLLPDSSQTAEQMAQRLDSLTVTAPESNATIVRNQFDIEGRAEDNRVIILSLDGKIIRTTLVENGTFTFKGLTAKPGHNHLVVRSINENGSSVLVEEIHFEYGPPAPAWGISDFARGNLAEKKIALTFDGDYLNNITDEILDMLKAEGVKCTVFLTGRYLRRYPESVKRMVADGHEIGNHSWTHPHLTTFEQNYQHHTLPGITAEILQQELLKTAELFRQITGKNMAPLWRAPYGEHNAQIRQWAAAVGFRHVGWTVGRNGDNGMDTLDWVADKNASIYHSAEEISEKILSFERKDGFGANGAIILMHLGTQRNDDYPHHKLPYIIQQLKLRGYQFATISEMM